MQKSNRRQDVLEKTWLITGGNGFIGVNLRDAIDPGDRVVVVDIKNHNRRFTDKAKVVNANVTSFRAMDQVFKKYKPNYVVHLAGNTKTRESMKMPKKFIKENVLGTLNCLDLAKKYECEGMVVASSCGVSGEHFCRIDEETECSPISPYGTSKLCCEEVADCYAGLGLRACSLRFANVYGPWSEHKSSAVAVFIKAFLKGNALKVNGVGSQTRNFIYVKDVAKSILLALKKKAKGVYCIASDSSMSVSDLVSLICEVGGSDAKMEFGDEVEGEIQDIAINNAKARRELRFQCEYSMLDGIRETMKWFKQRRRGIL